MNDDELFAALGARARARREAEDPLWDALSEGALPPEDRGALHDRAAEDPDVLTRIHAHRPMGRDVRERIVRRLADERRIVGPEPVEDEALEPVEDEVPQAPTPAPPRPAVIPFPSPAEPPRRRVPAWVAPLALAALALFALNLPKGDPGLPPYVAAFSGGDQPMRSGSADPGLPHLSPGSGFAWLLRPARAVEGPVDVGLWITRDDEVRPLTVSAQVSEDGAVRVVGNVDDLGPLEGRWDLVIRVGRVGAGPRDAADVARALHEGTTSGDDWILERQPVEVQAP